MEDFGYTKETFCPIYVGDIKKKLLADVLFFLAWLMTDLAH